MRNEGAGAVKMGNQGATPRKIWAVVFLLAVFLEIGWITSKVLETRRQLTTIEALLKVRAEAIRDPCKTSEEWKTGENSQPRSHTTASEVWPIARDSIPSFTIDHCTPDGPNCFIVQGGGHEERKTKEKPHSEE